MEQELTQEEQDALIRDELTQGINWEEETETDTQEDESTEQVEEIEEQETETNDDEDKGNTSKPKSKIAKVLHQRNEARKEAETYKSEAETLRERLKKLEEAGEYWSEEYVQTLIDKRMAENQEKNDFFEEKEDLKPYKKDILDYQKETWLSLEKASKLYLAENAPEMLLDEQSRNKQKANNYNTTWYTSASLKQNIKTEYSSNELDKMIASGKVKL